MKKLLLVALLFLTVNLSAQTKKKPVETTSVSKSAFISAAKTTIVIKGNIKNFIGDIAGIPHYVAIGC
ncbi:hypothetical protein [Mucilaginibacter kameinonensis]|uniref:hypothetical protein n=1 Tax=Mucilaginibacter kameinonensis TaxID=452286 RepID=UPI000EF8436E|nr:hypothetical protein [Mucilaginibacter kameinonensis]